MSDVYNLDLNPTCSYIDHSIFTVKGPMQLSQCDASVQVLKSIFGQPIQVLTDATVSSTNTPIHSLITLFIGHFNAAIIGLALVIYGYMTVVGVINTINEGKLGGRVMGHWWYPIRAIIPPAMLFPIKGGFCALQFLLMYTVLIGVNIANQVWHASVNDINGGYVPTTPQALNTAVAKDVGLIFVYSAVDQIMGQNKINTQIHVTMGKADVIGSAFAKQLQGSLLKTCQNRRERIKDPASCQAAVNDMFTYNQPTMLAPAAPGPVSANEFKDTEKRYFQYAIGFGSAPGKVDGKYIASGTYNINIDNVLGPLTDTGPINTADIARLLSGGSIDKSGISIASNTDLVKSVVNGGQPAAACTEGTKCSFSGVIDGVMAALIKENPPLKTNDVVQGTGKTCAKICRQEGTNLPLANWNHDPSTCNVKGYRIQPDNQCYQLVPETDHAPAYAREIPPQPVSNSWWYGSRVYLQLNEQMAENIKQLATDIQNFTINPDAINKVATFTPDKKNGIDGVGVYVTFKQKEYNYDGTSYITERALGPQTITLKGDAVPVGSFALPDWQTLTCTLSPRLPLGMDPSNCIEKLQGANSQLAPGTEVTFGGSAADSAGVHYKTYPRDLAFYDEVLKIPPEYQPPIGILIELLYHGKLTYPDFKSYVTNIIHVLKINHIYPGSQVAPTDGGVDSSGLSNPVSYWIGSMFNRMMGVNVPGIGGNIQTGGLFQDIYSLGNVPLDSPSQVISNSLNTIAQAQRIGLEMINTVTLSLENVYTHFKSKLAGFRREDEKVAASVGAGAIGTGIGLTIYGSAFANSISSAIAIAGQTALQFMLADQMHQIAEDLMWLPLLFVVLTSLFTAGVSFALLLPLVPFILFWAGQIAWILGVIEAMIAAPLVVLGLMTPGGHEHFGHMLPGVKMWLSLIFRPVLMVLGLLVGLVLTFIVIRFSSQAFQLVANQIITFAGATDNYGTFSVSKMAYADNVSLTKGVISCIMLTTFCAFMVLAFNKCFSCIYVVPEKVMQWVGGMADKAGEQELQQMSSSVTQSSQQGAQAAGQGAEKGIGADSQYTQQEGSAYSSSLGQGVQIAHQVTRESQGADMKNQRENQE